jgi:hypothetical protein
MMDFALSNRDLEIAHGDFLLCATDTDAIAQALSIRLKTLAGEWFLDSRVGIPYLTDILGKKVNERLLRKTVTEEVKSLLGISDIKDFVVKAGQTDRSISIRFSAILPNHTTITINESIEV